LEEIFSDCYQDGKELAAARSRLPIDTFPVKPIASLDENWLPFSFSVAERILTPDEVKQLDESARSERDKAIT